MLHLVDLKNAFYDLEILISPFDHFMIAILIRFGGLVWLCTYLCPSGGDNRVVLSGRDRRTNEREHTTANSDKGRITVCILTMVVALLALLIIGNGA